MLLGKRLEDDDLPLQACGQAVHRRAFCQRAARLAGEARRRPGAGRRRAPRARAGGRCAPPRRRTRGRRRGARRPPRGSPREGGSRPTSAAPPRGRRPSPAAPRARRRRGRCSRAGQGSARSSPPAASRPGRRWRSGRRAGRRSPGSSRARTRGLRSGSGSKVTRTTRRSATRRISARPASRSRQWCAVSTAIAASKLPSSKGSCFGTCLHGRSRFGGSLGDHLRRGLDRGHVAGGRLVGAGPGTDVDDRPRVAERRLDPRRDPSGRAA